MCCVCSGLRSFTPLEDEDPHEAPENCLIWTSVVGNVTVDKRNRASSVCIVSDYGLSNPAIWVRTPAEEKNFSSSLCVQTSSETHPASSNVCRGLISVDKARPWRDSENSTHLMPRSIMSRSYTSSIPQRLHGV
jgi:hypothetical protein